MRMVCGAWNLLTSGKMRRLNQVIVAVPVLLGLHCAPLCTAASTWLLSVYRHTEPEDGEGGRKSIVI